MSTPVQWCPDLFSLYLTVLAALLLQVAQTEADFREREVSLAEMQAVASTHAAREAALQGREAAAEATQAALEARTAELKVMSAISSDWSWRQLAANWRFEHHVQHWQRLCAACVVCQQYSGKVGL